MSDSPALERRITVGAIPTLAPYLLPSLIVRCKKRYPNLQINVQEDFKQNLLRAVLEGEIDLAVVALPIEESRVHVESLLKEPLLLAMGKNHPLGRPPVDRRRRTWRIRISSCWAPPAPSLRR